MQRTQPHPFPLSKRKVLQRVKPRSVTTRSKDLNEPEFAGGSADDLGKPPRSGPKSPEDLLLQSLDYDVRVIQLDDADGKAVQRAAIGHINSSHEAPHFVAPLGVRRHLPLFIFLPGLDGTGLYLASQLDNLKEHYDVRCLAIPPTDRLSYTELADIVFDFICRERAARGTGVGGCSGGSLVTVAGESFGAPIGLTLAVSHPEAAQILLVINSGSSLRRHPLLFYGSYLVPLIPDALYEGGAYSIAPFLSDIRRMGEENRKLIMPPLSVQIVPKDTVNHRVRLMADFTLSDASISGIKAETLCIASGRDRLLASLAESRRLSALIPSCQVHIIHEASHTALLEKETDLAAILEEAMLLPSNSTIVNPAEISPIHPSTSSDPRSASAAAPQGAPSPAPSAPRPPRRVSMQHARGSSAASAAAKVAAAEAQAAAAKLAVTRATVKDARAAAANFRANPSDQAAHESAQKAVSKLVELSQQSSTFSLPPPRSPPHETVSTSTLPPSSPASTPPNSSTPLTGQPAPAAVAPPARTPPSQAAAPKRSSKKKKKRSSLSEEGMTGRLAGANIDRMFEEVPLMRAWNWVTRPEFSGLENVASVADQAPLLFVGNHTIYGVFDMPLMMYELRKTFGISLRGLAHPLHYETPFGELFARYGAVKATPRNYFKLLDAGEAVLLYPGGAREVAKRHGEKYKLLWKDETDFVRLAMRFGATIVPFSAVGVDDAFDIKMDATDLLGSPVVGNTIREMLKEAGLDGDDSPIDPADAVPPLATGLGGLPFVPSASRLYFHFGTPIATDMYSKADIENRELCQTLYKDVQKSVADGIQELQELRADDPLRDLMPRTILSAFELWDGS
ncbi:hypothetical protein CYMTET_48630 [Cymbomonas tetramitiformis]|uniref:Phospholipid/glycerol acyltransferase domain-containing protein n=1 Tax=Cymbomonas tetramitiformis TaxID=36881 RepID=A0AAE0BRZ9_9CHLO|nr:hypothetical protein CYMTET_48630 [Cymbomonas tetramitiformis]